MQTFITCLSFLVRCMLKQCFILSYTIIKVLCIQKSFFPLLFRNKAGLTLKTNPRLPRNSLNSQVSFELLPRSEITGVNHQAHLLLWVLFSFLGQSSFCVVLAGVELTEILLLLPWKYQNYKRVPTHRAYTRISKYNWIPLGMKHQPGLYSKVRSQ